MNIISASRRTDIPAFHHKRLMEHIHSGHIEVTNPYSKYKQQVSLDPDSVLAIIFWSKDYSKMIDSLKILKNMGYRMHFQFTINDYPKDFERNTRPFESVIKPSLYKLCNLFSPHHISWRYDPIIITNKTPVSYHLDKFEILCRNIYKMTESCTFSFVHLYGKVIDSFSRASENQEITHQITSIENQMDMISRMAIIAGNFNMGLKTCCNDKFLELTNVTKSHCVDLDIIKKTYPDIKDMIARKPTRSECGCTKSIDIGTYNTCSHNCIYCYAS